MEKPKTITSTRMTCFARIYSPCLSISSFLSCLYTTTSFRSLGFACFLARFFGRCNRRLFTFKRLFDWLCVRRRWRCFTARDCNLWRLFQMIQNFVIMSRELRNIFEIPQILATISDPFVAIVIGSLVFNSLENNLVSVSLSKVYKNTMFSP